MAQLPRKRSESGGGLLGFRDEMSRLFERFLEGGSHPALFGSGGFAPALDMVETEKEIVVKAELPGMDPGEIDISLTGDTLTLKGEKKSEREEKRENVHVVERSFGRFSRAVSLPAYADRDAVSAEYKDGVLTVHIGKREEARGRSVEVQVK